MPVQNVIFDMGNVLIRFDPEHFVQRENLSDPADAALLLNKVFRSPDWPRLDSGELTEEELEEKVCPALPERLRPTAHRLIYRWEKPVEPIPGMAGIVADCKARGWGVYLLSNASVRQPEYWPDIPGSEWFDGAVISALERCVKPMPEIYRRLLDRYGLDPADCVFIDDGQPNVDAAIRLGMRGICFSGDTDALRRALFDL